MKRSLNKRSLFFCLLLVVSASCLAFHLSGWNKVQIILSLQRLQGFNAAESNTTTTTRLSNINSTREGGNAEILMSSNKNGTFVRGDVGWLDHLTSTSLPSSQVVTVNTPPSDLTRVDTTNTTPSDLTRVDATNTTLSDLTRVDTSNTTPSDLTQNLTGVDTANTPSSDLTRVDTANTTPSDLTRVDTANTTPSDLTRVDTANIPPTNLTRGDTVTRTNTVWCSSVEVNFTGPIMINSSNVMPSELSANYPYLAPGGHLQPDSCHPEQRVAIIIPYRDRSRHLYTLLNNLIPLLHKQLVDVIIFVIEQAPPTTFNRGALFNIGFLESQKYGHFDCFIFHDVDMVPTNDQCLYRCGTKPRHFIAGINSKRLPYEDYFGGVVGMTTDQYVNINGHSNLYFGWGGEDDDLLIRCHARHFRYVRYPVTVGRYISFLHMRDRGNEPNPDRFRLLRTARRRQAVEGLNTVFYHTKSVEHRPAYTWIYVSINMRKTLQTAPDYMRDDMIYMLNHSE